MVLVVAGLCFRVTAVPFHFYAPDVYQGTIQANAALLSVLPKAAGLLALVRLIVLGMPEMGPFAWKIFLALSVLTMTLGNVLALWQENVRRLFAYSSIANAGYMLIGLAVGLAPGTGTMCGWPVGRHGGHVLLPLRVRGGHARHVRGLGVPRPPAAADRDRRGTGRPGPHPPDMAAALAVCMFSLAGLPPAAGLWGKLLLFGSALNVQAASGGPAAVVHRAGHHRRVECGGGGLLLSPHRQPDVLPRTAGRAPGRRRPRPLRRGVAVQPGRTGVGLLSRAADERVRRGGEGAGSREQGAEGREQGDEAGKAGWHAFTPGHPAQRVGGVGMLEAGGREER